MIDTLSECQKAAKQLNLSFEEEEDANDYPGGCYVLNSLPALVYFNKNLKGASEENIKPICGQGKYDKYIIQFLSLDNINDV